MVIKEEKEEKKSICCGPIKPRKKRATMSDISAVKTTTTFHCSDHFRQVVTDVGTEVVREWQLVISLTSVDLDHILRAVMFICIMHLMKTVVSAASDALTRPLPDRHWGRHRRRRDYGVRRRGRLRHRGGRDVAVTPGSTAFTHDF